MMVAWHLRLTPLLEVRSGYTAMQYNTALALGLTGAALAVVVLGRLRRFAAIAATVDVAFGVATLIQYMTGRSLGIDELLIKPYLVGPQGHPGRMAPNTALCLIVIGAGLFQRVWKGGRTRSAVLAVAGSVVASVGIVAVFGYISGLNTAYGWGKVTAMALPTAVAIVLAGAGMTALAWSDSQSSASFFPAWLAIPIGALALGTIMFLSLAFIQIGGDERIPASRVTSGITFVGLIVAIVVGMTTWLAQRARRQHRATEELAGRLEDEVIRRTQAEESARQSERRTFAFLEGLPVGVFVVNSTGEPFYLNRHAQELLGKPAIAGVEAKDLPAAYQAYVAGTDQIYPSERMASVRAIQGSAAHEDDLEIDGPNGRVAVEAWSVPIYGQDGMLEFAVTAFADISERRQRERAIAQQAALLDLAHDAIFVCDDRRRITYWNRGAERLYGFTAAEATGTVVEQLLRTEFVVPLARIQEALDTTGDWEGELTHHTRDGNARVVETRWAAYGADDGDAGTLEICRDITRRKEAEAELVHRAAELDDANRELARANHRLQESNRDLEQFAYAASHDLSEPLRAISGPISLLARRYSEQLDEEADQFITFAVDGCERMQQIIDGLLAYSRVGRLEGRHQVIEADELLAVARRALGPSIAASGAVITSDPLPAVRGEPIQLAQVFQNLLSNAIKFHSPGRHPEVHVSARREGSQWCFTISDNGIGVPAHQRERVFGMFKRLHGRDEYPGTGIGLALCKRIIERHGGQIGIEDRDGLEGSQFWFTLADTTKDATEESDEGE